MTAARLVFPGFRFGVDEPKRALALADLGVGGFCLYGGRPAQVAAFTTRLRARAKAPLLFCADYEDGVATQCPGGTALPSNMGLGASGDAALARRKGELTALEAGALGVRWVLAPVVDLADEPRNPIVNIRSFGADPAEVARLAGAYARGLRAGGALACLKHFPGHGRTRQDSHLELARVEASRAGMARRELVPFRRLAKSAGAVMTGHLSVPALERDRGLPFSLSPASGRLLRGSLGFDGLIVTDALDMRAVAGRCPELEAAERALRAGADVLLVPKDPEALVGGLREAARHDERLAAAVAAAERRLERAVRQVGTSTKGLRLVGSRARRREAEQMAERCLAWAAKPAAAGLGRRFRYAEPAAPRAAWAGRAFLKELRALGADVRSAEGKADEDATLVLGCFLRPRAYSGRIVYSRSEVLAAQKLLRRFPRSVAIAFGSPFVLEQFAGFGAALCAFSGHEPAQRAAARALMDKAAVRGRMPVTLRLTETSWR